MLPQTAEPRALIFTDLDGTLLDQRTYDFSDALPALGESRRLGVVVILCSSKTRGEMLLWQARLGLRGPFVSENGGGVFLTGGGPLERRFPQTVGGLPAAVFGASYSELRAALADVRARWGARVRGFGDMEAGEVSRLTGLSGEEAELARQREFDEPFLWEPPPSPRELEAVGEWVTSRGLDLVQGGRFWHLTGRNDKGKAVRWLLDAFEAAFGRRSPSLALGDSENDLPMLLAADRGVLVERPMGGHLSGASPQVERGEGIGPKGWCRAVCGWLGEISR